MSYDRTASKRLVNYRPGHRPSVQEPFRLLEFISSKQISESLSRGFDTVYGYDFSRIIQFSQSQVSLSLASTTSSYY